MIKPIVIKVTDKVPELVSGPDYVVCDNSDYTEVWQLDEEWAQFEHRTMQVNYKDGTYERVLFTGDTCALPALPVPGPVHVGLFAGDIHTTRPARLLAVRSGTTSSGEERDPMPNGYAQAIQALDAKLDKNQGAENAGKALVVGDDGNVVPGEAQGGSYTLPVASPEQLGGVKPTAKTDEMTQQVGVDEDGALYTKPGKASDPVQSDWQQNDETAADYVKNRPGGYTKTTPGYEITWDGVVGDKVVVGIGDNIQLVKVSDRIFTTEELVGATMIVEDKSTTLSDNNVVIQNGIIIANQTIVVCSAPGTLEGIMLPEAGTYFYKGSETTFVSSLSKPGSTTTVKIPANLLQSDPAAVLINPAKYPTDDDPQPSSPVVILYTDEMIDESGALINPPAKYATGFVYVEKQDHETVAIHNDLFPTGEWLSMGLNRFGNTVYGILIRDKYAQVSVSGPRSNTNTGAPVILSDRTFMNLVGFSTTTVPSYMESLITGVVVAIISQATNFVEVLAKKIQPYEEVEFKIVTTNSSGSGQVDFTPITSSDEGEIIDLIAAMGGGIAGVAKCNQKNAWYARKFHVDYYSGDDGIVRGHFLTGYGAYEAVAPSDLILSSTTSGSTKKFRITVDDSGTLSAVEVTDAS